MEFNEAYYKIKENYEETKKVWTDRGYPENQTKTMYDTQAIGVLLEAVEKIATIPHGDLIDRNELLNKTHGGDWNGVGFDREYVYYNDIRNAEAIIPSNKEQFKDLDEQNIER